MQHVKEHTGTNLCLCDLCNIAFTQKGNLTQHLTTHTGEKPYKCEFCDKFFAVTFENISN